MKLSQHLLTATAVTATVLSFSPLSAEAANLFGTSGIQFDQTTRVDFTFPGSNNQFRSAVQIFEQADPATPLATLFSERRRADVEPTTNPPTNWIATCNSTNGAVANCNNSFTFQAGVLYTLGLLSVSTTANNRFDPNNGPRFPYVYSTNSLNDPYTVGSVTSSQRVIFGSFGSATEGALFNAGSFTSADPFAGIVRIAFEDGAYETELEDLDFNDFTITASARPVPTPPVLGGLMMFGVLGYLRYRRQNAAKE